MPINNPKPTAPPPRYLPRHGDCLRGTGAGFIKQYMYLYAYIKTKRQNKYWIYPVKMMDNYVVAYVWKNNKWVYSKIALSAIDIIY